MEGINKARYPVMYFYPLMVWHKSKGDLMSRFFFVVSLAAVHRLSRHQFFQISLLKRFVQFNAIFI